MYLQNNIRPYNIENVRINKNQWEKRYGINGARGADNKISIAGGL